MENPYAPPTNPPVNPYAPPQAEVATAGGGLKGYDDFYTVGPLKFAVLALCTFGLYVLYWFYKNWKIIRMREVSSEIWPFWRAVFTALWTFSMGNYFHRYAREEEFELEFPHTAIGIAFLFTNAISNLPDPFWLISFLGFLIVIPFDTAARRLNGGGELAKPTDGKFTALNVVCILIGGLFFALAIVGLLMGDQV